MARVEPKPPEGMRGSWVAEGAVAVFSVPLPVTTGLDVLTQAQRAVVELLLQGLSGAEIARRRDVKRTTVYKQLEHAYRRLGVGSKAELAALIASQTAR